MIKKILLWFAVILVAVLAVLSYVGYKSFNTDAFKNHIVKSVQEATGRTFTVHGNYQLVWDPLPTITLENVSLSNIENRSNAEMLKADQVQIQIEWASLLKSPSRIKSILIVNPDILVERVSRTVTNMDFPKLFAAQDNMTTETLLGQPRTQALIDDIRIENGNLQYINQITNQSYRWTELNGQIHMGTLSGPFSFKGTGTYEKIPWDINVALSNHELSSPIDVSVDLKSKGSDVHFKLDGRLNPENPDQYLSGTVSFDIPKPNALLQQIGWPLLPESQNVNFIGSTTLDFGITKANLSDCILKLGTGDDAPAANITYSKEDSNKIGLANIEITRLDLDAFAPMLTEIYKQNLLQTLATEFKLNIANITWHQKGATTLNVNGVISNNQLYIPEKQASILLPGQTTIQMSGRAYLDASEKNILAQIDLQSQDLTAAMAFLAPPKSVTDILKDAKKAELTAALELSPEKFTLAIPAVSINNITGSAHFEKTQNIETILELNNISLDDYWTIPFAKDSTPQIALKKLFDYLAQWQLPATPAHWELTLNNATLEEINFQNITAVADTTEQTLALEAVANTQEQDSLVLKSDIQNIGTQNWQTSQTLFEITGSELPELLSKFHIVFDTLLTKDAHTFSTQGKLVGNPQNWQINMLYETPVLSLDTTGQIVNQEPTNLHISFKHNALPNLLTNLWSANPFRLLGGELLLETDLTKQQNILTLSDLFLQLDTEEMGGSATYNLNTHDWDIVLAGETIDLQKLLPDLNRFYLAATGFDGNPFDLTVLKKLKGKLEFNADTLTYQTTILKNAKVLAHIDDNTLYLDEFITKGEGTTPSTLEARGTFNWTQMPTFNFKIASQKLPFVTPFTMFDGVGLTGGFISSEWNLAAAGETPLQMARSLKGNGQIRLEKTAWIGADFASLLHTISQALKNEDTKETLTTKIKHLLTNGSTSLEKISGNFTINDGLWQIAAAEINSDSVLTNSATIDWDIPTGNIKAKAPLTLRDFTSLPSLVLKFLKEQKGTAYSIESEAFISSLIESLTKQKAALQAALQQAQQKAQKAALAKAKEATLHLFQSFTAQLNETEQQLKATPNSDIQKAFYNSMLMHQHLQTMLQAKGITQEQYQTIFNQIQSAQTDLEKVKDKLAEQQKKELQQQAQVLSQETEALVAKINEMYQKRPTISLLVELLEKTQKQQAIILRAIEQFKKPLSLEQTKKVFDIIKSTHEQITQTHSYAEEIYSGRQSVSTTNAIQRVN